MNAWDRQERESETAHSAFRLYLGMGAERSLKAVQEARGVTKSAVAEMAKRHNWGERARAFDNYVGQRELDAALTVRAASLAEYSEAVTRALTVKLIVVDGVVSEELRKISDAQQNGGAVDMMALRRLLSVIREGDDLARRAASLPTAYRSATAERDADENGEVYYIGTGGAGTADNANDQQARAGFARF